MRFSPVRISRRSLLGRIAAGAAVTAVAPSLAQGSLPADAARTLESAGANQHGGLVQLNRNENAYGPSEKAIATMREAARVAGCYPQARSEDLRIKIASFHGVQPAQVVLGCGSSEILRMAVDAFVGPGKRIVAALPTYELVGQYARRARAEVVSVLLSGNYSHDLHAMRARCDLATGLVYICNPNNPTGSLTPRQDLEAFLRMLPAGIHVLIDEAYHHYVGQSSDYVSFIDRPVDDGRVIVARSFSKIYGLAGMRVGYVIAAPQVASLLASHRLPENVNVVAALAAIAALDDAEHVRTCARLNADDRQEFFNQASARMARTIDSHTNFVMVNTERPSVEVIEHFKRNDVLVAQPYAPLDKHIRVSLGAPAAMREFWRVWDLMPHKMSM